MRPELPELSEYQLDCLQRFVRFELPIETLGKVLAPLVTFTLDGPATYQTVGCKIPITLIDKCFGEQTAQLVQTPGYINNLAGLVRPP